MAYPTIGEAYEDLYARINVPWGLDEAWGDPQTLYCNGPSTEDPDTEYNVIFLIDFSAMDSETPFTAGQVLRLHDNTGGTIMEDGTSFVYTKP